MLTDSVAGRLLSGHGYIHFRPGDDKLVEQTSKQTSKNAKNSEPEDVLKHTRKRTITAKPWTDQIRVVCCTDFINHIRHFESSMVSQKGYDGENLSSSVFAHSWWGRCTMILLHSGTWADLRVCNCWRLPGPCHVDLLHTSSTLLYHAFHIHMFLLTHNLHMSTFTLTISLNVLSMLCSVCFYSIIHLLQY